MFSGDGFAGMHFNVEAVPPDQFKAWVDETRSSGGKTLDSDAYKDLVQAEHQRRAVCLLGHRADLFQKILTQALPPGPGPESAAYPDPWLAWCGGK